MRATKKTTGMNIPTRLTPFLALACLAGLLGLRPGPPGARGRAGRVATGDCSALLPAAPHREAGIDAGPGAAGGAGDGASLAWSAGVASCGAALAGAAAATRRGGVVGGECRAILNSSSGIFCRHRPSKAPQPPSAGVPQASEPIGNRGEVVHHPSRCRRIRRSWLLRGAGFFSLCGESRRRPTPMTIAASAALRPAGAAVAWKSAKSNAAPQRARSALPIAPPAARPCPSGEGDQFAAAEGRAGRQSRQPAAARRPVPGRAETSRSPAPRPARRRRRPSIAVTDGAALGGNRGVGFGLFSGDQALLAQLLSAVACRLHRPCWRGRPTSSRMKASALS